MEEIIDRLWGADAPNGAPTTVRSYVKRLRRQLDTDGAESVIRTESGGYRLVPTAYVLDWHQFRKAIDQAAATTDPTAEERILHHALALWRGEPLCDVASDSLHRELVPALSERHRQALHRRIELVMERGGHEEVVAQLRRLVGADPLQERFWAQLIRALNSTGRSAEAVVCYEQCRRELAGQLGVDPGTELRSLHQSLLTGVPQAAPAGAGRPAPRPARPGRSARGAVGHSVLPNPTARPVAPVRSWFGAGPS